MGRAMAESAYHPSLSSALYYRDPKAALLWLEEAFGFEPVMVILDADDRLAHAEMRFGDGLIMIGTEWADDYKSPSSVGGKNTQTVHVQLTAEHGGDVDAHCERARKAGARIVMGLEDQFYGDRTYRAMDPEGHVWTFGQTIAAMQPEDWDKATGFRTQTRL
jgi:uncharacterized glyoxalase superfamily protein PhnB